MIAKITMLGVFLGILFYIPFSEESSRKEYGKFLMKTSYTHL